MAKVYKYKTVTELSRKQKMLGSDDNNKTVNIPIELILNEVNSIVDQKIPSDLGTLATKEYVDQKFNEVDVDLSGYYTSEQIDLKLENIEVDLTGYATETYVNNQGFLKANALTNYATQSWVENKNYLTTETDPSVPSYVKSITTSNISNWNNKQNQLTAGSNISIVGNTISANVDLTGYATQTWVESQNFATTSEIPTNTSDLVNDIDFITSSDLPTVGNGTITINQGGTLKGTFTTNQSGNTTIDLSEGITSFKTINGNTITGTGNITIASGGTKMQVKEVNSKQLSLSENMRDNAYDGYGSVNLTWDTNSSLNPPGENHVNKINSIGIGPLVKVTSPNSVSIGGSNTLSSNSSEAFQIALGYFIKAENTGSSRCVYLGTHINHREGTDTFIVNLATNNIRRADVWGSRNTMINSSVSVIGSTSSLNNNNIVIGGSSVVVSTNNTTTINGSSIKADVANCYYYGKHNAPTTSTALVCVGNGTSDTERSNAYQLHNNGNSEQQGDVEITTIGKGVIMKSPNGTRYRIKVNDDGTLTTELAT